MLNGFTQVGAFLLGAGVGFVVGVFTPGITRMLKHLFVTTTQDVVSTAKADLEALKSAIDAILKKL